MLRFKDQRKTSGELCDKIDTADGGHAGRTTAKNLVLNEKNRVCNLQKSTTNGQGEIGTTCCALTSPSLSSLATECV